MLFLTDQEDPVGVYEAKAVDRKYTHEAGMDALSAGLGRVQQVEMVHGESSLPLHWYNYHHHLLP